MRVASQKLVVTFVVGAAFLFVTAVAFLLALASTRSPARAPAAKVPRR